MALRSSLCRSASQTAVLLHESSACWHPQGTHAAVGCTGATCTATTQPMLPALRFETCAVQTQHPLPLWASLPQLCWRLHPQPQAAFPARTAGERGDPWHGDDSQSTLPVFRTRLSAVLSPSDIFVCLSKNWDCKGKRMKAWQKALCNEAQHSGGEVKHFGCPIVIWFSMTKKNKKQKTSKLKAASFPFSVNTFPFVIQQISAFPTPIP